jgi:hypothetical protein
MLRVMQDDRVGVMELRAQAVQMIERHAARYFVEPTEGHVGMLEFAEPTRAIVDLIHDLTTVHWSFRNLDVEEVEEMLESGRDALGIAATLSVRVRAFGDEKEPRAREVFQKAQRVAVQRSDGAEPARVRALPTRPARGRRPRLPPGK